MREFRGSRPRALLPGHSISVVATAVPEFRKERDPEPQGLIGAHGG